MILTATEMAAVKCWCCGNEAYIVVLGQYPLCLECGRIHFKSNRLAKKAVGK